MVAIPMIADLRKLTGQRALIEFSDGEVVVAVILKVDPDEHEDITFDVETVRRAVRATPYEKRNVYVAPIRDLRSVRAADGGVP